jgi:hypothetical protein
MPEPEVHRPEVIKFPQAHSSRQAVVPCDTDIPYGGSDMTEGAIVTEPYFSDVLVPVMLAHEAPQSK